MLRPAIRDLQWRRRRFAFAILGTSVVFGMTLAITGISSGFGAEASRTVNALHVDAWVVKKGATGPFLGAIPMAASDVTAITHLRGVTRAVATVFNRANVLKDGIPTPVNVFGAPTGVLAMPSAAEGRAPERSGEIAVSSRLPGYSLGSRLLLGGRTFTVVGKVNNATALAGVPNVYLTLGDAQRAVFAGLPVASAIAVSGVLPQHLPTGFTVVSNQGAQTDLLSALTQATSSISLLAILLWIVAAMIVGSIIYVSVLERQRDFAVYKATGVSSSAILGGLVVQAIILTLAAAVIGSAVAPLIAPAFPVVVSLTLESFLLLPAIAVAIGLVASIAGLRRAVSIDPAVAFGGP